MKKETLLSLKRNDMIVEAENKPKHRFVQYD